MTLIVVNQGEEAILTDGVTGIAYDLRLYTNDVTAGLTPSEIDELTEADFDEATFTGYAAASVSTGDWTITQADPTEAVNVTQSFTSTADQAPEAIRGYWLTRTSDGALIWFEAFDGPVTVEFDEDEIQITPRITLDDREGNDVQTGTITAFGGEDAPTGWLLCDGSAVSRTTFAGLFAVIGTSYGSGDGSTTFELPDLRQRFPLGLADSGTGAALGDTGGAIDHAHDLDTASSHAKIFISAAGNGVGQLRKSVTSWTSTHEGGSFGAASANSRSTGTELGGESDTANPPFVTVQFIIKD